MDKKTVEFLNSLQNVEEVLSTPLECDMPYYDHTPDTLEDTGRNPG